MRQRLISSEKGRGSLAVVAVAALAVLGTAATASAELELTHVTDEEMLILMPESELSATAEGRIGDRGGAATFELDIGRRTSAPTQTAQYDWQSGVVEPFTLSYDDLGNVVTFTLGGVALTYTPDRPFDTAFLRTRAVDDASSAVLDDLVLNGEIIGDLSSAVGPDATDILMVAGGGIYGGFVLTGTAVLTWGTPVPTQSRLAFQIKLGSVSSTSLDRGTWGEIKSIFR